MCFTCFNFIFHGKKVDLNLFDTSARLSKFALYFLCCTWRFVFNALAVLFGRREAPRPIVSMYVCISAIDNVCLVVIHDVQ